MTRIRRAVALLVAAGLVALASPAVAASGSGLAATVATPYGGALRTFNLYVPGRVPALTPVPLILVLHGLYLDPATQEAASGLDAVADTQDVALAYPAGEGGSWNAGACCGHSAAQQVDDVGFLVHVVDLIRQIRPIDLARVYLAGFSNGGMLALAAECDRPDVFAAAVSVAGTLETPCAGNRPVTALMINGLVDRTVPYAGSRRSPLLGAALTPVPAAAARLAKRSRCVDNVGYRAQRYRRTEYVGCAGGSSVQLLTVPGLGHHWPDAQRDGVDGGALTWEFLRAQRRLS